MLRAWPTSARPTSQLGGWAAGHDVQKAKPVEVRSQASGAVQDSGCRTEPQDEISKYSILANLIIDRTMSV